METASLSPPVKARRGRPVECFTARLAALITVEGLRVSPDYVEAEIAGIAVQAAAGASSPCWLWQGAVAGHSTHGEPWTPVIWSEGQARPVPRRVMEKFNGEPLGPTWAVVRTCPQRRCVCPHHHRLAPRFTSRHGGPGRPPARLSGLIYEPVLDLKDQVKAAMVLAWDYYELHGLEGGRAEMQRDLSERFASDAIDEAYSNVLRAEHII